MDHKSMLAELFEYIKLNDTNKFMEKIKIYHDKDLSVDEINKHGNTLLHMACKSRNYEIVKALISTYGARVDIQNVDGRTPLHIATIYGATNITYYIAQNKKNKKQIENSSDIISLMIEHSPHILIMPDKDNMTPINYYSIHSNPESNKTMSANYKSYKRKMKFFDSIKNNNDTINNKQNNYKLTLDIYFLLKKAQ
jgi:ankyrin repeat protein